MLKKFFPDLICNSVYDLNFAEIRSKGISLLIFDIDNTLVPYTTKSATKEVANFLRGIADYGFDVALVSNNNEFRVKEFNKTLGYFSVFSAKKPFTSGLKRVMSNFSKSIKETAIVGDQILTDIYGGNRLGIHTILVTPIENKENVFFKVKRKIEKCIIRKMEGRKPYEK